MNVLLVEDDVALADGLSRLLQSHKMNVEVTHNGNEADSFLQHTQFSVVILDIGLPGIDGFEVVRRLRKRGCQTPVLLLTARDAIDDRVYGLELGADDYLVKPFATQELVARIKALLRRGNAPAIELTVGALVLDSYAKEIRVNDKAIELSAREWAVLEYLIRQRSRIVSKQQIIDAITPWGEELTLNAVEVYISRIRLKITGANVEIRTIRGFGYRLEEISA
ncbi:MAG: response regulator transcription factor [Pseudomonadota bacterium]